MPKHSKDHTPPPGERGKPEAMPSRSETTQAAASNDGAGAGGQVQPATSDSPEATATSPARHDGFGNPDLPEQKTDHNPSPGESRATEPTPSQEDLIDAALWNNAA